MSVTRLFKDLALAVNSEDAEILRSLLDRAHQALIAQADLVDTMGGEIEGQRHEQFWILARGRLLDAVAASSFRVRQADALRSGLTEMARERAKAAEHLDLSLAVLSDFDIQHPHVKGLFNAETEKTNAIVPQGAGRQETQFC